MPFKPKYKPLHNRPKVSGYKPKGGFYQSAAWMATRNAYRNDNPICAECEKMGIIEPMSDVDHILPIDQGGAPHDFNNLQSLCKSCHSSKSSRERRDLNSNSHNEQ